MKPMKRAISRFSHYAGIYNFNESWDAKVFADMLKAKVEYINAFAKCNLGFTTIHKDRYTISR